MSLARLTTWPPFGGWISDHAPPLCMHSVQHPCLLFFQDTARVGSPFCHSEGNHVRRPDSIHRLHVHSLSEIRAEDAGADADLTAALVHSSGGRAHSHPPRPHMPLRVSSSSTATTRELTAAHLPPPHIPPARAPSVRARERQCRSGEEASAPGEPGVHARLVTTDEAPEL